MNEARVGGESSACVETHWFSESGVIDLFLLLGPAITGVFQQYRQLTGATPLPPVVFAVAVIQFDFASLSVFPPLPSNAHHRSSGDCLEGKGENYQVCSVQYCVQQLCTARCTHI